MRAACNLGSGVQVGTVFCWVAYAGGWLVLSRSRAGCRRASGNREMSGREGNPCFVGTGMQAHVMTLHSWEMIHTA